MSTKKPDTGLPMDYDAALQTLAGEKAFLLELLNDYEEEFTSSFNAMKKAVADKDFETIEQSGHRLKGASSALFMEPLRRAAQEMEQAGKSSEIENARTALQSLENEFARLLEFLKDKILPRRD